MFNNESLKKAFHEICPGKNFILSVKYSSKFSAYSGNIRKQGNLIELRLSSDWKEIDEDIVAGFAQQLIFRIFRIKNSGNSRTFSMRLYDNFVKNIHIAVKKSIQVPELLDSFNRINQKYFDGDINAPNLDWGSFSHAKMGSYDFKRDLIKINPLLQERKDLLDYVMYHEILHKKHKFTNSDVKTNYHTKQFRSDEKKFENSELMEEKLSCLARNFAGKLRCRKSGSQRRRKNSGLHKFLVKFIK